MKKSVILTLVFALFLTSCFKKEVEKTGTWEVNSWVVSTWEISTWELNTWVVKEKIQTWNLESNLSENSLSDDIEISENNWLVNYKNLTKKYEISFKKSEDFSVEEAWNWTFLIVENISKNILTVVTQKYLELPWVNSFESYVDLWIEDIKKIVEIKDLKKEKYSLNWKDGYKITYSIEDKAFTQYIFEKEETAYIIIKVLSDSSKDSEFQTIIDTFKIL